MSRIESEFSLPRATEKPEEGSKNGLRSDLTASNFKNFRMQSYSARPIQFCFHWACKGAVSVLALKQWQLKPNEVVGNNGLHCKNKVVIVAKYLVTTVA